MLCICEERGRRKVESEGSWERVSKICKMRFDIVLSTMCAGFSQFSSE